MLATCACTLYRLPLLPCPLPVLAERVGPTLRRFAFSGFGGTITAGGFHSLAATCSLLTAFALDGNDNLDSNAVVKAVADNCPHLKDLSAYDLDQVCPPSLSTSSPVNQLTSQQRIGPLVNGQVVNKVI